LPAAVARSVGPIVELRECSLGSGKSALERLSDPDIGQSTDRLDRAIADALAESLCATQLRASCQRGHTMLCAISSRLEFFAYRDEIQLLRERTHLKALPATA
jgi:hypothetical protein